MLLEDVSGGLFRQWQLDEDLEQLVCLRRWAGEKVGSWGVCEDAAKLGKPGKEVKTFAVMRGSGNEGAWMLNQVHNSFCTPAFQPKHRNSLNTISVSGFATVGLFDTYRVFSVFNKAGLKWCFHFV